MDPTTILIRMYAERGLALQRVENDLRSIGFNDPTTLRLINEAKEINRIIVLNIPRISLTSVRNIRLISTLIQRFGERINALLRSPIALVAILVAGEKSLSSSPFIHGRTRSEREIRALDALIKLGY